MTTITSPSVSALAVHRAPRVYVKPTWSAEWTFDPTIEAIRWSWCASSDDLSMCELIRRYGPDVKNPYASGFEAVDRKELNGWWVQVRAYPYGSAPQPTYIVSDVVDSPFAGESDAGMQKIVGYGPKQLLRKMIPSRSIWLVDGSERNIDWVPVFNGAPDGSQAGNRSASESNGSYLFGGTSEWTHAQAVRYMLRVATTDTGPTWSLFGDLTVLNNSTARVPMPDGDTLSGWIGRIISRERGMDYFVTVTSTGFGLYVFSLSELDVNGMPGNPRRFRLDHTTSQSPSDVQISISDDHKYDSIVAVGENILVCTSLSDGTRAAGSQLKPQWSTTQQTAYNAAAGSDYGDVNDRYRQSEKFAAVYQDYAYPDDALPKDINASPRLNQDGSVLDSLADYQRSFRKTESWLPLLEGYDYSTDPATSRVTDEASPEYQAPMAVLYDTKTEKYVLAETAGISVYPQHRAWGVRLSALPNHLLAAGNTLFDGAAVSDVQPRFDPKSMHATIAIRTDRAIRYTIDLPEEHRAGDGSQLTIRVPDAELWLLAPSSVVGVDQNGALVRSPSTWVTLRDDIDAVYNAAVGAYYRYIRQRSRAVFSYHGIYEYGSALGCILTTVDSGGDRYNIHSVVTRIEWSNAGSPKTTIYAGYAG